MIFFRRVFWIFPALAIFVAFGLLFYSRNLSEALGRPEEADHLIEIQNNTQEATDSSLAISDQVISSKYIPSGYVTQKGNELLVLINKTIRLPENFAPADLVSLKGKVLLSHSAASLRKTTAEALVKMFADAKKDGFELAVTSAYRSYYQQVTTFNYWVKTSGLTAASSFSALPGHSQHQLGTTVDISSSSVSYTLTTKFGETKEGKWLAENSYKYGFALSYPKGKEHITGYSYEPWHFRYIGEQAAVQLHDLNWDLETYLQKYGVW